MDDGELELSDHILVLNSDSCSNVHASDSFLDDLLRNSQTCTHTHTCNPPGPDAAHTHTCYHTHTNVIPSEEDDVPASTRRPLGNREAVRKYREKKKAHAAYLEEEVKKLRHVNQVLMAKLRRQAILETEVLRLRSLLLGLRGKVDDELGEFPFQKQHNSFEHTSVMNNLDGPSVPSNAIGRCGRTTSTWESDCQPPTIHCEANANYLETFASSSPQER